MRSTRFERTPRLDGHGDIVGLAYLPRDREDGVAELDYCFLGNSYPHLAVTIRNGCDR
jgi:hypothetical protein